MFLPDGPEERTADFAEQSERDHDAEDAREQRADEYRDDLIETQTQRILTGAAMIVMLCVCFTFGGCATIERHPVLTAIGTAVIVGSIAASVEQHGNQSNGGRQVSPSLGPQCRNAVCAR